MARQMARDQDVAAVDLAGIEQGSGPPLFVLHGLFGSARNWGGIARRLAESHRVVALDLRNHGASPWAPGMSYPAMAADVRQAMTSRGVARATVLGHSMGGKTAMLLALRHPEAVERLIVADIAPVPYAHTHLAYIQAMRAIDPSRLGRRADVEAALSPAVTDRAMRLFLMHNLVNGPNGLRWQLNLAVLESAMRTMVGDIGASEAGPYKGPALFIRGETSDYVRPEHTARILELFPAAEFLTIPGAGHWLHADKPDEFTQAVEAFLSRSVG